MLRRSALYNTLLNNASAATRTSFDSTLEIEDDLFLPPARAPRVIDLDRWYHLIILAWLYTGRLSQEDYVLPRCFFYYINIYHSADEDHDLPELKKAVTEVLARYQIDHTEGNDDYDAQHFLFLVYGYKGGLDRELRRSMMESSIDDY